MCERESETLNTGGARRHSGDSGASRELGQQCELGSPAAITGSARQN